MQHKDDGTGSDMWPEIKGDTMTTTQADRIKTVEAFTFCSIKGCKLPAESARPLHMPFCISHQASLIGAIEERINARLGV